VTITPNLEEWDSGTRMILVSFHLSFDVRFGVPNCGHHVADG